jgi:Ni/Co efflux regulator RcnB
MKRIILVLTAALLLAAMTVAVAPAMAQDEKKQETKMEEKKGDDKDKDKDKDLPKSGGLPINASLLGLGAGVLLVGGGLFAVRIARQDRR